MNKIAIYGAGGFGREVFCLIQKINAASPRWEVIGFFDDGKPKGEPVGRYGKVLGGVKELNSWPDSLAVVVAAGCSENMRKIVGGIQSPNITFPNIIHPDVVYADEESVTMGKGNIVQRNSAFSCDVKMGDFNVFNGGTVLGHDVVLGSYNVLMPAVRISGSTTVGDGNFFGISSIVLQGLKIGNGVTLSAGSVLMRKAKDGKLYIGNPAKLMDILENDKVIQQFIDMELKDFIANFAEQFDETDASVFTAETAFHDLDEYSSLIALSIIAMVDEEYDVALKGDDMKSAVTIEDLYNIVKSKM